jgi:hypothetical protein
MNPADAEARGAQIAVASRVPMLRAEEVASHSLDRVRSEYLEMPGLSLTGRQAARLWGMDTHQCEVLFDALVASGFLRRTPRGAYVRVGRG